MFTYDQSGFPLGGVVNQTLGNHPREAAGWTEKQWLTSWSLKKVTCMLADHKLMGYSCFLRTPPGKVQPALLGILSHF